MSVDKYIQNVYQRERDRDWPGVQGEGEGGWKGSGRGRAFEAWGAAPLMEGAAERPGRLELGWVRPSNICSVKKARLEPDWEGLSMTNWRTRRESL